MSRKISTYKEQIIKLKLEKELTLGVSRGIRDAHMEDLTGLAKLVQDVTDRIENQKKEQFSCNFSLACLDSLHSFLARCLENKISFDEDSVEQLLDILQKAKWSCHAWMHEFNEKYLALKEYTFGKDDDGK